MFCNGTRGRVKVCETEVKRKHFLFVLAFYLSFLIVVFYTLAAEWRSSKFDTRLGSSESGRRSRESYQWCNRRCFATIYSVNQRLAGLGLSLRRDQVQAPLRGYPSSFGFSRKQADQDEDDSKHDEAELEELHDVRGIVFFRIRRLSLSLLRRRWMKTGSECE